MAEVLSPSQININTAPSVSSVGFSPGFSESTSPIVSGESGGSFKGFKLPSTVPEISDRSSEDGGFSGSISPIQGPIEFDFSGLKPSIDIAGGSLIPSPKTPSPPEVSELPFNIPYNPLDNIDELGGRYIPAEIPMVKSWEQVKPLPTGSEEETNEPTDFPMETPFIPNINILESPSLLETDSSPVEQPVLDIRQKPELDLVSLELENDIAYSRQVTTLLEEAGITSDPVTFVNEVLQEKYPELAIGTQESPITDQDVQEITNEVVDNMKKPVIDESAMENRRSEAKKAIKSAFEIKEETGLKVEVDGEEIVDEYEVKQGQISEIAKGGSDGSIGEMLQDTAKVDKLTSTETAETVVFSLIEQNPAVEIATGGRPVTQEDVDRVLKGKTNVYNLDYNI